MGDTSIRAILGGVALVLAFGTAALFIFYLIRSRRQPNIRNMMDSYQRGDGNAELRNRLMNDRSGEVYEQIKAQTKRKEVKKRELTIEERLFQAGMFTERDRAEFQRWRLLYPIIIAPIATIVIWSFSGAEMGLIGLILGLGLGYQAPFTALDRRIKRRHEDIMFYLPLVIEQISIGVSSSLDVGPCIQRVITMADERDSHNVVTELLRHAQNYIKSGVGFEDAMIETGKATGHTELKHAFMYLAQVAKHGGEITRQLQELADSVSSQRQTHIEGKIKKLEVIATGPVSLVFLGFLLMLLTGFGIQLKSAI